MFENKQLTKELEPDLVTVISIYFPHDNYETVKNKNVREEIDRRWKRELGYKKNRSPSGNNIKPQEILAKR